MVALAKPSAAPLSELSAHLIELNYQQIGCDSWSRPRFQRLCGKLHRTPREMAAFLRIKPRELEARLATQFTPQDGIILTTLEREADLLIGGQQPTRGIFMFVTLQSKDGV